MICFLNVMLHSWSIRLNIRLHEQRPEDYLKHSLPMGPPLSRSAARSGAGTTMLYDNLGGRMRRSGRRWSPCPGSAPFFAANVDHLLPSMPRTELGPFAACNAVVRYGCTLLVLAGPALTTKIYHAVSRVPTAELRPLAPDDTEARLRAATCVPAGLAADVDHRCRRMCRAELGLPVALARNTKARARKASWLPAPLRPDVDCAWSRVLDAKLCGLAARGSKRRSRGTPRVTAPLRVAEVGHAVR